MESIKTPIIKAPKTVSAQIIAPRKSFVFITCTVVRALVSGAQFKTVMRTNNVPIGDSSDKKRKLAKDKC